MPMQTPNDLFMHELEDMLDAEQRIYKMLPELAKECSNPQVKDAFEQHERETQQQIQNLEKAFQTLGSKPQRSACYGVQGLKQEHDHFLEEKPAPEILQMFDIGAGEKTEHYEITSYTGLIEKATLMGQTDVAQLLKQNLQQEEAMAKKLKGLGQQLGKEQIKQTATV